MSTFIRLATNILDCTYGTFHVSFSTVGCWEKTRIALPLILFMKLRSRFQLAVFPRSHQNTLPGGFKKKITLIGQESKLNKRTLKFAIIKCFLHMTGNFMNFQINCSDLYASYTEFFTCSLRLSYDLCNPDFKSNVMQDMCFNFILWKRHWWTDLTYWDGLEIAIIDKVS